MKINNNLRKVLFILGSRGEYGYVRPILQLLKKEKGMVFEVLLCNMHLLPEFGSTADEFIKDGISIDWKVFNTLDGYNLVTMTKSLGVFLTSIPEILEKSKPNLVLVSGDRGEQLMATIAATNMNIPVAHIQAGEVSGNIDGNVRHAITKLAHIHFCSSLDAYNRVLSLGEEDFRVFNVGAPLIDELISAPIIDVRDKYNINKKSSLFLVVQHSTTETFDKAEEEMTQTLRAINKFDAEVIVIMPNSDAGCEGIKKAINKYKTDRYTIFRNLPRYEYINFMRVATLIIGNSSSGIMESPTFKIPAINIGRRQEGRLRASNVINVDYNPSYTHIKKAINIALSKEFRGNLKSVINPYGDGRSAEKILRILKDIKINDKLLLKKITY